MSATFCTRCGKPVPPNSTACPTCGNALAQVASGPVAGQPTPPGTPLRTCGNCQAQMRWTGHFNLRAMGLTGPVNYLSGASAASETVLPFSLYYCQSCGKFDLYYPGT
ncbi:MAG TPA: zinc-ribbon domain-containing protein [Thermoplasmata archaeon]|nr:zinc-ribbon domain-containing protein [Thermoplasmata archaeon]